MEKDNRCLKKVIEEIFDGIDMPKDLDALCRLLDLEHDSSTQDIIYWHPCMWSTAEVISNLLFIKYEVNAYASMRRIEPREYRKARQELKEILEETQNWQDLVNTVPILKRELISYEKKRKKKQAKEYSESSSARVGVGTLPGIASPMTPTQSPIDDRMTTSSGIGLVGSSSGMASSSGTSLVGSSSGIAGSSESKKLEGSSIVLLKFMGSCFNHQEGGLKGIVKMFFVLFPLFLSHLAEKSKDLQFIKDICKRKSGEFVACKKKRSWIRLGVMLINTFSFIDGESRATISDLHVQRRTIDTLLIMRCGF